MPGNNERSYGILWFDNKTQECFLGISMSGSCLGAFVLAPVSSYLSENHGWKATVGLYAGKKFDPILECILIYIE